MNRFAFSIGVEVLIFVIGTALLVGFMIWAWKTRKARRAKER
ncbi:hypothetical protein PP175_15360 [Aneurinibacillus sp. Ricciae_BoGa-3]|nr:hypothetical protein [Aneurinibacillus sp. Ricciae_BoGa-3]WCK52799.1 hypothetical protein PP175_15360 [Aneurinibacillus sp. Ricciae_BoGa-3]